MQRFQRAVVVGMLSLAATAGAQPPTRTIVSVKTPLKRLRVERTFYVMAHETRSEAGLTFIDVVFRDAQNTELKSVSTVYGAGQPAIVKLAHSELPEITDTATIWADITLSRTGSFADSAAGLSFEFDDGSGSGGCYSCSAESPAVACSKMPDSGRKPEFTCPGGTAFVERISVVR